MLGVCRDGMKRHRHYAILNARCVVFRCWFLFDLYFIVGMDVWDCPVLVFIGSIVSLSVAVCVRSSYQLGAVKPISAFNSYIHIHLRIHFEKCSLLVSMLRAHSIGPEIDLCLFSNMEHGSIVFRLFLYEYLFEACYLSLAHNKQTHTYWASEWGGDRKRTA